MGACRRCGLQELLKRRAAFGQCGRGSEVFAAARVRGAARTGAVWMRIAALPARQGASVAEIKNTLIQCGALGANMSGSGPTAFGLFTEEEQARRAAEQLLQNYRETFLAHTV